MLFCTCLTTLPEAPLPRVNTEATPFPGYQHTHLAEAVLQDLPHHVSQTSLASLSLSSPLLCIINLFKANALCKVNGTACVIHCTVKQDCFQNPVCFPLWRIQSVTQREEGKQKPFPTSYCSAFISKRCNLLCSEHLLYLL